MLSRCPFCQTVFQVTDDQLASAHGLVRCGQCQEVFDAGEYLCDEDAPVLTDENSLSTEHEYDWQPAADATGEPDNTTDNQTDWVSDQPATLSAEEETTTVERTHDATTDITPDLSPPDDLPDISAAPLEIRDDLIERHHGPDRSYGRWLGASLLLVVVLALQFIWFERDALANNHPAMRNWLQSFCRLTGCELAPVANPGQIRIISREVRYHPKNKKAIQINMTIANIAPHDQPWPVIQLVLTNNRTGYRAMRRFKAADYLPAGTPSRHMKTDTPVTLSLNVLKPGKYAPDYMISFLKPAAH